MANLHSSYMDSSENFLNSLVFLPHEKAAKNYTEMLKTLNQRVLELLVSYNLDLERVRYSRSKLNLNGV